MVTYSEKLRDPRWRNRRSQILARAGGLCELCMNEGDGGILYVHHGYYVHGLEPWEYPDEALHCLCEACHAEADEARVFIKAFAGSIPMEAQLMLVKAFKSIERLTAGEMMEAINAIQVYCGGWNASH